MKSVSIALFLMAAVSPLFADAEYLFGKTTYYSQQEPALQMTRGVSPKEPDLALSDNTSRLRYSEKTYSIKGKDNQTLLKSGIVSPPTGWKIQYFKRDKDKGELVFYTHDQILAFIISLYKFDPSAYSMYGNKGFIYFEKGKAEQGAAANP